MAASTPKPEAPDTTGFSVVDCTGNSDIEDSSAQGEVRPEDVKAGTTPLPVYPHPSDFPETVRSAEPQPYLTPSPRQGGDL